MPSSAYAVLCLLLLLGFLFLPADVNNVTAVRYFSEKYHKSTDIPFNNILDLNVLSSTNSTNTNNTATQFISSTETWSAYASLNGVIKDENDPVVIANADGRLQVFVVGADNALYYKSQISAGSNTWSEWQPLSGALRDNSNPAVILNFDGRLETFVIGSGSNSVFHKFQNSPGSTDWSPYDSLGGGVRFNSSPDSLCRETEFQLVFTTYCQQLPLQIFVIGFDNGLYHTWRDTP